MTAGFYKKEENGIQYAPNCVEGSGFVLHKDNKDDNLYPVEGWFWFNTAEEAYAKFSNVDVETSPTVTPRQIRLALLTVGITPDMVTNVLSGNDAASVEWEYASTVERNHPLVNMLGAAIGKTEVEIDLLFKLAKTF